MITDEVRSHSDEDTGEVEATLESSQEEGEEGRRKRRCLCFCHMLDFQFISWNAITEYLPLHGVHLAKSRTDQTNLLSHLYPATFILLLCTHQLSSKGFQGSSDVAIQIDLQTGGGAT